MAVELKIVSYRCFLAVHRLVYAISISNNNWPINCLSSLVAAPRRRGLRLQYLISNNCRLHIDPKEQQRQKQPNLPPRVSCTIYYLHDLFHFDLTLISDALVPSVSGFIFRTRPKSIEPLEEVRISDLWLTPTLSLITLSNRWHNSTGDGRHE